MKRRTAVVKNYEEPKGDDEEGSDFTTMRVTRSKAETQSSLTLSQITLPSKKRRFI